MIKVIPNNGNETKSDVSLWDIVKSDTTSFLSKNTKSMTFKIKTEMKHNQTFFHGTYSNLTSFFIGHKPIKMIKKTFFK